ncbi:hypothetical protein A9Q96_15200 [Rhodobacterales bacterium 52_120_T64]|nr:hypothetical protein A9Q96_15200 [Rhodobacterales bacterium 52_120_T64]
MTALVFLSPWILLGLLTLPVLWWLLRATPPSPKHLRFPGVRLLLGLKDIEKMPNKTPVWLLLLRMLAVAAAIFAFAEPVLNPETRADGDGPLLILMDGGWASAPDWSDRVAEAERLLAQAARAGRPTVFASLSHPLPQGMPYDDARNWLSVLRALEPQPWAPDRQAGVTWLADKQNFETYWLTDGLQHDDAGLTNRIASIGQLRIIGTTSRPLALLPLELEAGQLNVTVIGTPSTAENFTLTAHGKAPNGTEVSFASVTGTLPANEAAVSVTFDMPVELTNRITRVTLYGQTSAGAVSLADDGSRRRKVALVGAPNQEGPQLVAPMHYLRKALAPSVSLLEGSLSDVLLGAPDVIVLPDVGQLSVSSSNTLLKWVENGGLLVRFAGPRLAAEGAGQVEDDPLLPVRLRAGGRTLGGAMAWNTPKNLSPFPEASPFFGLSVPADIEVFAQVVAQPAPDLAQRTLAALDDGTPLVTQRLQGDGRVVLFHVTANAEWSTLPLSGLFVQMLERLSISASTGDVDAVLEGRMWQPDKILDGFGRLIDADLAAPVSGERLAAPVGPDARPGLYTSGDLNVAVNVMQAGDALVALELPIGTSIEKLGQSNEQSLKAWFLILALTLFMLDIMGTLWATGRLFNHGVARAVGILLMAGLIPISEVKADEASAIMAANDTVLAYVITGDPNVDTVSSAGLLGLSIVLFDRTSIEPIAPIGVNIETDDLSLLPMLYWPMTTDQPALTQGAVQRLNRYLATGGMIVFDTRDAQLGSGFGVLTPNGKMLQRVTESLDIPPLNPVPSGHVLTRAFYLLEDFPGRWSGPDVWVEVSSGGADQNDGVTPIVIGANDWASAWAVFESGQPMFPVGRGLTGERQRELARRFGVNLVMYVMTGNYKADQVHVPALLERIGE